MKLFYTSKIENDVAILSEEEAAHATQIFRLKLNDIVHVTRGDGKIYEAQIIQIEKRLCALKLLKIIENFNISSYLNMAIAPTKNIERFEYFLEKTTEIGIQSITPLVSQRSERNVIKPERLEKLLVSAMKQSLSGFLPKLNAMQTFEQFLKNVPDVEQKFIAHCNSNSLPLLKNLYQKNTNCVILIGPEGDFTTAEVEKAEQQNFISISLGNRRLRTETAGVVAAHTIALLNL